MKSNRSLTAAAVVALFAVSACATYPTSQMPASVDEGVPPSLVTAMKSDEGVPQNLITAMNADEGVPHNLVTTA